VYERGTTTNYCYRKVTIHTVISIAAKTVKLALVLGSGAAYLCSQKLIDVWTNINHWSNIHWKSYR